MVKHIVMWSFKEGITEEKKTELKAQIKEHLEETCRGCSGAFESRGCYRPASIQYP